MYARLEALLAAALALGPAVALAQPAPAGQDGGAFPVIVITRDQLLSSGKASIGEYLQALPQQGNGYNAQVLEGGGAATVDLRSLGPGRTLVLVDGRRVVPGGGFLAVGSDVDLAAIPLQAVERLEISTGGGSAVHGSEAVAGVVNVVTRRGLAGTEAAATLGATSRGDAAVVAVSALTGQQGERGGFVLGVGYTRVGSVLAGDRPWASTLHGYDYATGTVGAPVVSTATPAGRFTLDPSTCATPACAALLDAYGPGVRAWTVDPSLPGGARPYLPGDAYDFQPARQLCAPNEVVTARAAGEHALGGAAVGYLEAAWVNRQSREQAAPTSLFTLNASSVVSAQSVYNPYGVDLTDVRRRLVELGPRTRAQDLDTFRVVAGVRGVLPDAFGPLRGWAWDAAFEYGRSSGTTTTTGDLVVPKLEAALGPSFLYPYDGQAYCGTLTNSIPGCVPLDLLHGPASITPDQLAGVTFTGIDSSEAALRTLRLSARGELFEVQAGHPSTLALGAELRDQSGSILPNPVAAAGESTGRNEIPISGRYDAQEAFAELSLPIWSGAPGLARLDVALAGRVFHYSTFGTDASYQAGVRYAPLPWLALRASASSAFRAPSIWALYTPVQETFPNVMDPCGGSGVGGAPSLLDPTSGLYAQCNATGVAQGAPAGGTANNGDDRTMLRSPIGGSPGLQPETARLLGLGLVAEPASGLTVTLDYSRVRLSGAFNALTASFILASCYTASPAPGTAASATTPQQHCDLIRRDPASGLITLIDDRLRNAGGTLASALDLSARYALHTTAGRLDLGLDGTWVLGHDTTLPDGSIVHQAGYGNSERADPALKLGARASWTRGSLAAGLAVRHVGRYRECDTISCSVDPAPATAPLFRTVASWTPVDLWVRWSPATRLGSTTLLCGVSNVLDQDPPASYAAFTANVADPATYDFLGRQLFVRLAHAY